MRLVVLFIETYLNGYLILIAYVIGSNRFKTVYEKS